MTLSGRQCWPRFHFSSLVIVLLPLQLINAYLGKNIAHDTSPCQHTTLLVSRFLKWLDKSMQPCINRVWTVCFTVLYAISCFCLPLLQNLPIPLEGSWHNSTTSRCQRLCIQPKTIVAAESSMGIWDTGGWLVTDEAENFRALAASTVNFG
jgi:hypothetical protein